MSHKIYAMSFASIYPDYETRAGQKRASGVTRMMTLPAW
jgi:hypothetical protein